MLKGWKEKEGMGSIPGATACPELSLPIYPGSASLIFGSWLFSGAPEGWIQRSRMEISHSHLVSSETPAWVQEKLLTFWKGCQPWSSGTWKSDTCTLLSLENPTWERP